MISLRKKYQNALIKRIDESNAKEEYKQKFKELLDITDDEHFSDTSQFIIHMLIFNGWFKKRWFVLVGEPKQILDNYDDLAKIEFEIDEDGNVDVYISASQMNWGCYDKES